MAAKKTKRKLWLVRNQENYWSIDEYSSFPSLADAERCAKDMHEGSESNELDGLEVLEVTVENRYTPTVTLKLQKQ